MTSKLLAVSAPALLLWAAAASAAGAPPPASAFGRLPAIDDAAISADGAKVAMLAAAADHRLVIIAPVDGQQAVTADIGPAEVRGISWAGNSYVLVRSSVLDRGSDSHSGLKYAFHRDRDFVLTPDGKVLTYLLKDNIASGFSTDLPILRILDTPKPTAIVEGFDFSSDFYGGPEDTHVAANITSSSLVSALWRVDVATGSSVRIDAGTALTEEWAVDRRGEPRVRIDYDGKQDKTDILARAKSAASWRVIATSGPHDAPVHLLGYSDPEDAVYLLNTGPDGRAQIVRHGLADASATVVPLPEPAHHADMVFDPHSASAIGVYTEIDQPNYRWLDPSLAEFSAKLQRVFAGKLVTFVDWSKDRRRLLVAVQSQDSPPVWYLADTASSQVSPIGSTYPELDGAAFGKTRWLTYKAGDGLEIPAYLTLPPGAPETGGKLPLIVLPHGGPASRDHAGFDWWVQFLATRGYAVLRPQYRGSSGFGDAFEEAGRKEWAGKMQTDLLDGIAALAAQGIVDPERVCIVGASYGGYAALAGAALHPEAYRCAVSVNGVADLGLFEGEQIRAYGEQSGSIDYWRRAIGSVVADAGLIAASSPARHAKNIGGPVLLIASSDDTTVPYEQSVVMKRALDKAGKSAELVTLQGDDHYLSTSATRTRMLEALEAFLAKNLPSAH
jgi:dipeptidyl aminopeptidase/acylaminoacyl peptidase